jgi:hypothetical protein
MADLLQRRRQIGGGASSAAPGAAPAGAPAQPAAAPQAPVQPQQRGSGFVSFDRYLAANQQGAQAMAQQLGTQVGAAGEAATTAINRGQDAFAQKSQAATLAYNPQQQGLDSAKAAELAKTGYKGPKDWGEAGVDVTGLTKQTMAAQAKAAALTSTGGVASLLRESYNTPAYTAGAVGLDAALAGAAGGQRFQQLNSIYGDLGAKLTAARGTSTGVYDASMAATKDAAAKYGALAPQLAAREQAAAAQAQRDSWQRQADAAQEREDRRNAARGNAGRVADDKKERNRRP